MQNEISFFHEESCRVILEEITALSRQSVETDDDNEACQCFIETVRLTVRLCKIILWHYKNAISHNIDSLKINGEFVEKNKFSIKTFLLKKDGTSIEFKNKYLNEVFWLMYNTDLAIEPLIIKWEEEAFELERSV